MIAGIMERSEQGGTLDAYEIETEIDKSVQAMLLMRVDMQINILQDKA